MEENACAGMVGCLADCAPASSLPAYDAFLQVSWDVMSLTEASGMSCT